MSRKVYGAAIVLIGTIAAAGPIGAAVATTAAAAPVAGAAIAVYSGVSVQDADHDDRRSAGDVVTVTYKLRNPGSEAVTGLHVADPLVPAVTCDATVIPAGGHIQCAGTHVLTVADMDRGSISSRAAVNGTGPAGETVTATTDELNVALHGAANLALTSRVAVADDRDGSGRASIGDRIVFEFTVTNTGTVTVTGTAVSAPTLQHAGVTVHCREATLAPSASTDCRSAVMTATSEQVRDGKLTSHAYPTATAATGRKTRGAGVETAVQVGPRLNAYPTLSDRPTPKKPGQVPTPQESTSAIAEKAQNGLSGTQALLVAGGAVLVGLAATGGIVGRRRRAD